jgi:predicted O-linked N-acetylglucosamine transferase (SPINDLY family)
MYKSDQNQAKTLSQSKIDFLVALYEKKYFAEAAIEAEKLTTDHPASFILWNILGTAYQAMGEFEKAERGFRRIVEIKPDFAPAYNNIAFALEEQGKLDQALVAYKQAIDIKPDFVEAYYNMGVTLHKQNTLHRAIETYKRVLELEPSHTKAYSNLGIALHHQGNLDDAIVAYKRALTQKPDYAPAWNNMGNALKDQGKLDDAIAAYESALALKPDYADAYNNMGIALQDQGKLDDAIAAYGRALALKPDYVDACNNMGIALQNQRKLDEAIAAYTRVLSLKPDFAYAYNNMGNALKDQGKLDEAMAAYERALDLKPNYAYAYNNMGNALKMRGRINDAITAYECALAIQPDYVAAEAELLHQKQHICDFNVTSISPETSTRFTGCSRIISPFAVLSWTDNPEEQLLHSRKWAAEYFKQPPYPLPARPKVYPTHLKVGYFSADFHDHATMFLLSGLLREHDTKNVEVFTYSYGAEKSGDWRIKAECDGDHFFDVTDLTDEDVSDLARSHGLDVAIDLKGYTENSRSDIFQYRSAPIQINYLGYPSSMGAEFIDYIIADPLVIPPEHCKFYTEKIIFLPNTYQPNDNVRVIAHTTTRRSDFNLPDDSFVFCCFNNNYKISRREFDIWMRLLGKVEGSVLWLLNSNEWAKTNLQKEAEKRGIDSSRLVFAAVLPHAEHLARHKHADLFIDTFNYNAHTTASDALWSGLPIVTKQGKQFAARVCASLLTAVGLPELITHSDTEYERLILELATDPERLGAIRADLAENRLTKPLFDTKLYTRHFEKGLWQAYSLYFNGKQPENLWA